MVFNNDWVDVNFKLEHIIKNLEEYSIRAHRHLGKLKGITVVKDDMVVRWRKPIGNAIKLNMDGSVNQRTGMAGLGCTARGEKGQWLVGETRSMGLVSPLKAELLATDYGLKMCWRRSYNSLELEYDSMEAINLVLGEKDGEGDVAELVQSCRKLLGRPWDVQIKHVLKEANVASEKLEKLDARREVGVFELPRALKELFTTLQEGAMGVERHQAKGGTIIC